MTLTAPSPVPSKQTPKRLVKKKADLALVKSEQLAPPAVKPRKHRKYSFWQFMWFAKPGYESFGPDFWELQRWCVLLGIVLAVIIDITGIHFLHLK